MEWEGAGEGGIGKLIYCRFNEKDEGTRRTRRPREKAGCDVRAHVRCGLPPRVQGQGRTGRILENPGVCACAWVQVA